MVMDACVFMIIFFLVHFMSINSEEVHFNDGDKI